MSNEEEEFETTEQEPTELDLLKERADLMGIQYHPNIGVEKLRAKIEEKQSSKEPVEDYGDEELDTIQTATKAESASMFAPGVKETPSQILARKKRDALRLVRIRVTNMNPIKGNMKGEIFSAGNSQIGMVKKYVPYNAEQGWHVPNIILQQLRKKKFMTFQETKIGNKKIKKHKLVPELAIEILPPLTAKELSELKQRQLMAAGQ